MGDPRCQCDTRLSAHPTPQCARFRQRLARRTALASSPRKSKHSAFAATLGLRRSNTPGKYKRRLWALVSEYVRRKAADSSGMVACVTCGKVVHWKEIHAGHYIAAKSGLSTYFHEQNIHPQCPRCNLFESGNLAQYALFMLKTYGPTILEELDELRRKQRQIKEPEWLELIDTYKKRLAQLEGPRV